MWQIYENGYIGLGGAAGSSSPQSFPFSDSNGLLAPFWADIARGSTTGSVFYRETTDSALLSRAMYEITLAYGGTVSISSLFIATWDQVGYAPNGLDKVELSYYTLCNGNINNLSTACMHVFHTPSFEVR